MFTTFLFGLTFVIVAGLAILLLARPRTAPTVSLRANAAPITVALITAVLVALGFLVM